MNSFMSGIVMVGGVAIAAVGGYQFSGALGSKPFHYENASHEERVAYLEAEAKPIAKGMKRALINPSGVGASMKLAGTEVDAGSRRIRFEIRVSGKLSKGKHFREVKDRMLQRVCGRYATMSLSTNDVSIVQDFVDAKKRRQGKITISNASCRSYI